MLQRGCKGAAQSFEEIAVDLPFKGEDQVLLPLISGTKIDIDAVHRDRVLPVLGCVVALKLHDEQAGASGIASPETGHGRSHRNLADIEVRSRNGDVIPRRGLRHRSHPPRQDRRRNLASAGARPCSRRH